MGARNYNGGCVGVNTIRVTIWPWRDVYESLHKHREDSNWREYSIREAEGSRVGSSRMNWKGNSISTLISCCLSMSRCGTMPWLIILCSGRAREKAAERHDTADRSVVA